MEQQHEEQDIPASHEGWEIKIVKPKSGPYGTETTIAVGTKNGVKLEGVAWAPRVAWATLRDMIRLRAQS